MAGTSAAWRGDRARPPQGRTSRRGPLRAAGHAIAEAWRDGEKFYDIVVVLSVALFFLIAIGVGIIALQWR
jgi:hypothetical protein